MYGKADFYAAIASNPALHRNLEYFKRPLEEKNKYPLTYISSAEFDNERFRKPLQKWQSHWQSKAPNWQRKFKNLPNHNHLSANPEVLRQGLKWIFSQESQ